MLEAYQAKFPTPFAVLGIRTVGERLASIDYLPTKAATLAPTNFLAARVCRQIERYLDDPGFRFDLPFEFRGTEYQRRVWQAICGIRSGSTKSYGEIARELHTAPRPVGMACGANRIPLLIPCHRVLASHGLGGFMHARRGPALEIKRWLLKHEGVTRDR